MTRTVYYIEEAQRLRNPFAGLRFLTSFGMTRTVYHIEEAQRLRNPVAGMRFLTSPANGRQVRNDK
ncbi:MAG: hypothetical protein CVU00_10330 [Bacteroidetes bacterium HGW-Bacteroidetes-17]|nr:MAG: hypothetical protein CVU00_10330 [Bacteroidetes bacterium HGW-Bacteroidetes-17]